MGLSIKNAEVERMAREIAARRRVSMTEALRQALTEADARVVPAADEDGGRGAGGGRDQPMDRPPTLAASPHDSDRSTPRNLHQ